MAKPQTHTDLISHLCEQVSFLRASAAAYDAGNDAEAKRMATAARVLCHDTANSKSLLGQLGLLHTLHFVDSAPERSDIATEARSEGAVQWVTVMSTMAPIAGGPRGHVAQLDKAPLAEAKRFGVWWNTPVFEDFDGHTLTRANVVLALANKDGGVHVDPKLGAAYQAMSREKSLGTITYIAEDGKERTADVNPVLAAMRQIAFELERTLADIVGTIS